jgi:hypothetical protein
MYSQRTMLDVRQGVLRIVGHVLQHHGEELTRGWVPILRLLENAGSNKVGGPLCALCITV